MTDADQIPPSAHGEAPGSRSRLLRWVGAALVLVALVSLVLWLVYRERELPATPEAGSTAPATLALRLTLFTGGPGDDAAGVVRLYAARARLAETVRNRADGRTWNGAVEGAEVPPAQLRLGVEEWKKSLAVERVDDGGTATAVSSGGWSIVSAPEGDLTFGGTDTHSLVIAVQADGVPPPGGRLRVRLAHAGVVGVSNAATVPVAAADHVESLGRSARVAELLRRFDLVAQRADEIVAAAPISPNGYWYRGIAREAGGDVPGAIEAFQAAADRVSRGDQEPPVGLDLRLARLRSR